MDCTIGSKRAAAGVAGAGARWAVVFLAVTVTMGMATVDPARAHEAHGHPAKLHAGTCAELGAVAFSLNGVGGSFDIAGTPVAATEAVNPDRAHEVLRSETALEAPLADLLATPHALMVYESDADLSAIACGDLGGSRLGDELAVGLADAGESGHSGIALFASAGDATTVRIYLGEALSEEGPSGTAAADGHDEAEEGESGNAHEEGEEHADDDEATPDAGA